MDINFELLLRTHDVKVTWPKMFYYHELLISVQVVDQLRPKASIVPQNPTSSRSNSVPMPSNSTVSCRSPRIFEGVRNRDSYHANIHPVQRFLSLPTSPWLSCDFPIQINKTRFIVLVTFIIVYPPPLQGRLLFSVILR